MEVTMTSRPSENEFASYFLRYVVLVPESDVLSSLETQVAELSRLLARVNPERETYRYAPGKWSVREVIGHLIDAERVFGYRAFCISRGEAAPLPSFDENSYVAESRYDERTLAELVAEFILTRRSNLAFLGQLTEGTWKRVGTASNKPISVRALAFIMVGHVRHHFNVLSTSYGISPGS